MSRNYLRALMSTLGDQEYFSLNGLVISSSGMPSDPILPPPSWRYGFSKFSKILKFRLSCVNPCALGFGNVLHSRHPEFLEAADAT